MFIGRTDAETEALILWSPVVKWWLLGKVVTPDAGKDWGQEEKWMTKDEKIGWYYGLNGLEFEQPPRVGDGQGNLICCSPWGCKESDMTEKLNWTEILISGVFCLDALYGASLSITNAWVQKLRDTINMKSNAKSIRRMNRKWKYGSGKADWSLKMMQDSGVGWVGGKYA